MNGIIKRAAAVLLAVTLLLTAFPLSAQAEDNNKEAVNTVQIDKTWLQAGNVLSVSTPGSSTPLSYSAIIPTIATNSNVNTAISGMLIFFISYSLLLSGVLFIIERPSVTSSVYSSSLPTDTPRAITLTFTS